MRTLVTLFMIIVALVVGAFAGYLYKQAESANLARQVSTLEAQLARALEDPGGATAS